MTTRLRPARPPRVLTACARGFFTQGAGPCGHGGVRKSQHRTQAMKHPIRERPPSDTSHRPLSLSKSSTARPHCHRHAVIAHLIHGPNIVVKCQPTAPEWSVWQAVARCESEPRNDSLRRERSRSGSASRCHRLPPLPPHGRRRARPPAPPAELPFAPAARAPPVAAPHAALHAGQQ